MAKPTKATKGKAKATPASTAPKGANPPRTPAQQSEAEPGGPDGKAYTLPIPPRLSRETRAQLTEGNRALCIRFPVNQHSHRCHATQYAILSHICEHNLKGLVETQLSGTAFVAALFDTTERRDRALAKFTKRATVFRWKGSVVELEVEKFGETAGDGSIVWFVACELGDTTAAVVDALDDAYDNPDYQVRQVLIHGVPTSTWAIRFDRAPYWHKGSKHLHVRNSISDTTHDRLVTRENAQKCRLCKGPHSAWECDGDSVITLGPVRYPAPGCHDSSDEEFDAAKIAALPPKTSKRKREEKTPPPEPEEETGDSGGPDTLMADVQEDAGDPSVNFGLPGAKKSLKGSSREPSKKRRASGSGKPGFN